MFNKVHRYIIYLVRFIKSPNKRNVIKELITEINRKGIITGVRSLLHKKSHFYEIDFDEEGSHPRKLSIKKYNKHTKIVLPKPAHPKVSIIIPIYNQVGYTYNCICSIYENNDFKDYEIIIADDNSAKNTDIIKNNFENIVILKNETNLGFLRNCNYAATKARGEYLVFLNNDTQVQKDWLAELLYIFENYKNVGLVGSKLIYPNGMLQEAGGIIWQDASGWNYGNRDNPLKPEYNYVKEVDYASGASLMIPNSVWKELGGFDENFIPAYYEDTDFCFQLRNKGYKVIYQPFSIVVHFEGVTHGRDLNKGMKKYQVENQKKFYDKWIGELKLKSENGKNIFIERDRTALKKHILVVDHYLPKVDKDAGSRCISNFIDSMIELDYHVTFLGENQKTPQHYMKHFQLKGVEILYGNNFNFHEQKWKKYLKEHLNYFDAILLSRSSVCSPILGFLRSHNYKGNIIYFGHDLGYLRLEEEAITKNDITIGKLAKKIKTEEDFMYKNADNALVLSYLELDYLKKYITKPLHYIPGYFFEVEKDVTPYESRDGILFVGGFNHPPNMDAMQWFLEEIYESLHKQQIKLVIAGSKMPESIFKYKNKYPLLSVLPDVSVEDLNTLYSKTRLAIVPLRYGAGVKGKVVEAMAKGVPVVGTEKAFEGMPKDKDFIYKGYNLAQELRDNILYTYSNKEYWETLSAFGKEYILHNFNKENMKVVFKSIIG